MWKTEEQCAKGIRYQVKSKHLQVGAIVSNMYYTIFDANLYNVIVQERV